MEYKKLKKEYPQQELTSRIIEAAIEVHKILGPGFEEIFYQRALAKEIQSRNLEFCREESIPVTYKGEKPGTKRVDFIIEPCIVELKACEKIEPVHIIQALSYLKASGYKIGLLLNFGSKKLEIKRLINELQHQSKNSFEEIVR